MPALAEEWFVWCILAGRGWGKTRTATENISRMIRGPTPLKAPPGAPAVMSIIADTPFDMRQYTLEGPSGFLNVGPPDHRPWHKASDRVLVWPNGCRAMLFSSEDPDTLRGASGSFFWWDEIAKSRYARDGWDNMLFGMREGDPRGIITTTPRPIPIIKEIVARKSTRLTRGSTWDNKGNLSSRFYREVIEPLEGTRLGRQEIEAEIIDDVPGSLWTRSIIELCRPKRDEMLDLRRVAIGVDPSGTGGGDAGNSIGIVAAAVDVEGQGIVLDDRTCSLSPDGWGRRVVDAYHEFEADVIVAEKNFGGAMVEHVIKTVDRRVNVKMVTASRGKAVRAEPVAALYEQRKVIHAKPLPKLEDQMVLMTTDGFEGDGSPDRVDAAVWALTELMLKPRMGDRVSLTGPVIHYG